jgi:ACT domain-containing protein
VLPDEILTGKGDILFCNPVNIGLSKQEIVDPKIYKWALSSGVIKESAITKQFSYTDKVTTKNKAKQKILIFGCWIIQEIVKETVKGKELAYAKAVFRMNDAIKKTPIENTTVCKYKKPSYMPPTFTLTDYNFTLKISDEKCNGNGKIFQNISELENETTLFRIKRSYSEKKGYIVSFSDL